MKYNFKRGLLFIICFLLFFCYFYFVSAVYSDEIWNYGVAYNIASGMIPYRDFNLVTTPLYPILASCLINLFGHHLYSFHIFNCIILSSIIMLCYHKIGKKVLIMVPVVLLNGYPGYNILSVFIIIVILNLCDYNFKNSDVWFGLLIGLLFLTKQTIGICLFIPLIFYSKNRVKTFISFMVPILIFIIYLVYNDAFYDFIDYCFLGLFNFGNSNGIYLFLPVVIIICIILIYYLFKCRFTNKKLFYLLMFQVITVPIVDDYHFMLGVIPCLYYFLSTCDIDGYKIKYYFIISFSFCFLWNFYVHSYELGHLYGDKDSYLYGRNIPIYVENSVTLIGDYIDSVKEEYDYIYFFSANAYWVKLNIEYPLTKYDMICNGNMGYNGGFKYIDEIDKYCDENKCMFILYKYEFREGNVSQTNRYLINYVVDNYEFYNDLDVFDIYIN